MAEYKFSEPRFQNPEAARVYLESIRWPNGPICPHCGGTERNTKSHSAAHRPGLYYCGDCREQFTVTIGTVFERSKVPLHKWVMATELICSGKKGVSAHQIHRMLGVTYKTAWFMMHRIREAMTGTPIGQLGSNGGPVEADDTFYGSNRTREEKMKVFSLVERNGDVRSFHVANVTAKTLKPILKAQVAKEAHLMTDEAPVFSKPGKMFKAHSTVNHSQKEYARGIVTTNTVESYFSLLKRGLYGTYHHVSEQHLKRYVSEFDFRYNNRKVTDTERALNVLKGISGKRLTYRRIGA